MPARYLLTIAADPNHARAQMAQPWCYSTWGSALTNSSHVHASFPAAVWSPDIERWVPAGAASSCRCAALAFFPTPFLEELAMRILLSFAVLRWSPRFADNNRFRRLVSRRCVDCEWVVYAKAPIRRAGSSARPIDPRYTTSVRISNRRRRLR